MEDKEIKWSAPEYHYYEKDVSWYWLTIIVAIILIAIAFWQRNFLFAVFIVISTALAVNLGRRPPRVIDFVLSKHGLEIGAYSRYRFEELSGFAIVPSLTDPEFSDLAVKPKSGFGNWIKIIIATQKAGDAKKILSVYMPELEYKESLTDQLVKILRF